MSNKPDRPGGHEPERAILKRIDVNVQANGRAIANSRAIINKTYAVALDNKAVLAKILKLVTPAAPDATAFKLAQYTQPLSEGDTPMIDPATLVPHNPGDPIPANSRYVIGVTNDPAGSKISGLTASSDIDGDVLVDSTDQATNYVLCNPPSDLTKDSVITIGDPDGSPTATVTIDWDKGVIMDATGFILGNFTQPMSTPVPTSARVRR